MYPSFQAKLLHQLTRSPWLAHPQTILLPSHAILSHLTATACTTIRLLRSASFRFRMYLSTRCFCASIP